MRDPTRLRSALPRGHSARDGATFGTLPDVSRRYGISLRRVRREAARGSFSVYLAGGGRRYVCFIEFESWLRSTRAPRTAHAEQRLAEILVRERRATAEIERADRRRMGKGERR